MKEHERAMWNRRIDAELGQMYEPGRPPWV